MRFPFGKGPRNGVLPLADVVQVLQAASGAQHTSSGAKRAIETLLMLTDLLAQSSETDPFPYVLDAILPPVVLLAKAQHDGTCRNVSNEAVQFLRQFAMVKPDALQLRMESIGPVLLNLACSVHEHESISSSRKNPYALCEKDTRMETCQTLINYISTHQPSTALRSRIV